MLVFSFFYFSVALLQCPIKALNVAYGNLFSNQLAFILLKTQVVQLFKLLYRKNRVVHFVEISTVGIR